MSRGPALAQIDYFVVFLGPEILPGSPGASPVTLPPAGQGGVEIPLHVLPQVSNYLDNLDVYYTN